MAALMKQIGEAVAVLHDGKLVHGDLTTSNMLIREADGALVRPTLGVPTNQIVTTMFSQFRIPRVVIKLNGGRHLSSASRRNQLVCVRS